MHSLYKSTQRNAIHYVSNASRFRDKHVRDEHITNVATCVSPCNSVSVTVWKYLSHWRKGAFSSVARWILEAGNMHGSCEP